jgi:hypothetical protein
MLDLALFGKDLREATEHALMLLCSRREAACLQTLRAAALALPDGYYREPGRRDLGAWATRVTGA